MRRSSAVAWLLLLHTRSAAARTCGKEAQSSPYTFSKYWPWVVYGERTWHLASCTILSLSTVTAAEMPAIVTALKSADELETIDLSQSKIGDAGATLLADALRTHSTIKFLDLSYCEIGDAGAAELTEALKSNSKVRMLVLRGPPVSTAAQMALDAVVQTDPSSRPAQFRKLVVERNLAETAHSSSSGGAGAAGVGKSNGSGSGASGAAVHEEL